MRRFDIHIEIPRADVLRAAEVIGKLKILDAPMIKNAWWRIAITRATDMTKLDKSHIRWRLLYAHP